MLQNFQFKTLNNDTNDKEKIRLTTMSSTAG